MAARNIGTIAIKGKVVIEWDNGTRQEIGEVSTQVDVILPDGEPVTMTMTREQEPKGDPLRPIATQYEVDRHMWKQNVSYADAWRYFEIQGYDMSEVDGQYEGGESE